MASLKNIAIDIGNTRLKWALFEGLELKSQGTLDLEEVPLHQWPFHNKMIVSSVRPEATSRYLRDSSSVITLTHDTPLPIELDYHTPETLGLDRIAAAVGAVSLFPDMDCLIIDLGTCITYDVVLREGSFKGGAIAPGHGMRLKAMHAFTEGLPHIEPSDDFSTSFPAKSTKESMLVGVEHGIIHEINGYIFFLRKEFADLCVILTGGDASFFESKIKAPIFVRPELNLIGLNRILLHNES